MSSLTQKQIESFNTEGVLCIPGFLTTQTVQQLWTEAVRILDELDLDKHPKTQFETGDGDHVSNLYFLESSENVSYFDTDACDANGVLRFPAEKAVNKIGPAFYTQNEIFRQVTLSEHVKCHCARSTLHEPPRAPEHAHL